MNLAQHKVRSNGLLEREVSAASLDRSTIINFTTKIHFGFGVIAELPSEVVRLGLVRPLLVTDEGLAKTAIIERVLALVPNAILFSGTPSNPTERAVRSAAAIYASEGCDSFIAVGGGSPMDLAKAAALVTTHQGALSDYALANGGLNKIRSDVPPVIAIPTTAGTGSEVARATVIIMESGNKLPIGSPHLIPKVAICDPNLTFDLPRLLRAGTGFDALAHCVEIFCSPNVNPPAEAIAIDGMLRMVGFLGRAVADKSDCEARWQCMMGSLQGGLGFQKGLGAVHALSHPLGELGLHHGTINAVLLGPVLEFNSRYIPEKIERLACILGVPSGSAVPEFFRSLTQAVGLPAGLREMGVKDEQIPDVCKKAERDSCNATNPVPLSASEYEVIMRAAMRG